MPDRAILFVDGSNWYHALKSIGLANPGRLNYAKLSQKLVGPRTWLHTRYYIGQVRQVGNLQLYRDQRSFLARLRNTDPRISTHMGRLEPRTAKNEAAKELRQYLHGLPAQIDRVVFHDLMSIANRHESTEIMVEKAVDVMLAVDLVTMAERDEFDAAYILSADGDYSPAVEAAIAQGKTVYACCPAPGAALASVVRAFIRPGLDWFDDCY